MLRAIVFVLLLANLGFYAWREGWLAPLHGVIGARPDGDREPERLAAQIRPEAVRLIPAEAASTAATPARPPAAPPGAASAPESGAASAAAAPTATPTATPTTASTACLEAGPYGPAEATAAEAALKVALPGGAWSRRELGPTWWVVMGPYDDAELMAKKRSELRRRGINPDAAPYRPGGAPVLVISRHDSEAAADSALAAWNERGVRSARVQPVGIAQWALRIAQADAPTQGLLAALPTDKLRGRSFVACAD